MSNSHDSAKKMTQDYAASRSPQLMLQHANAPLAGNGHFQSERRDDFSFNKVWEFLQKDGLFTRLCDSGVIANPNALRMLGQSHATTMDSMSTCTSWASSTSSTFTNSFVSSRGHMFAGPFSSLDDQSQRLESVSMGMSMSWSFPEDSTDLSSSDSKKRFASTSSSDLPDRKKAKKTEDEECLDDDSELSVGPGVPV
eukprot:756461-Hanusia_phi.AAC.3